MGSKRRSRKAVKGMQRATKAFKGAKAQAEAAKKRLKNAAQQVGQAGKTAIRTIPGTVEDIIEGVDDLTEKDWGKGVYNLGKGVVKLGKGAYQVGKHLGRAIAELIPIRNHPEWYVRAGQPMTSLAFNSIRGAKPALQYGETVGMAIGFNQTIPGTTQMASDSIAMATDVSVWQGAIATLYQQLGGSNASLYPFSVEDLASYIENARAIYLYLHHMIKVVKALNTFNSYDLNSNLPLLGTLGIGVGSNQVVNTIGARANIIDRLNIISSKVVTQIPLPPNMSVFERDAWLMGNVFMDDADEFKSSKIAFYPVTLMGNTDGNSNVIKQISGVPLLGNATIDACISFLNVLINNMTSSSVKMGIAAYLLKAYGDRAYHNLPLLRAEDKLVPIYDEQFLMQFQNSDVWEAVKVPSDGISMTSSVFKDYGRYSLSGLSTSETDQVIDVPNVVSTDKPDLTPGEVMSVVQNASAYQYALIGNYPRVYGTTVGTEAYSAATFVAYGDGKLYTIDYQTLKHHAADDDLLYMAQAHSHVFGSPNMKVLLPNTETDVINTHNGGKSFYRYIGDNKITAPYDRNTAAVINDYSTLSKYKTIDIQEQDNWRATTRK